MLQGEGEGETLPRVTPENALAAIALLVHERAGLHGEATRVRNQLHALLLQIDPTYEQHLVRPLRRHSGAAALETYVAPGDDARARAAAVRRLAARLRLLLEQAELLARQIRALAAPRYAPLAELAGVDLLSAGALAAVLGTRAFTSDAALAAYAGVAPLEASSGEHVHHRLNRHGDRQLNALLHRIAVTQARVTPAAQAYIARRRSEGKTWREAVRTLQRYVARAIWRQWRRCLPPPVALPAGGTA